MLIMRDVSEWGRPAQLFSKWSLEPINGSKLPIKRYSMVIKEDKIFFEIGQLRISVTSQFVFLKLTVSPNNRLQNFREAFTIFIQAWFSSEVTWLKCNLYWKKKMQRPGIEPGPPAWQARILPLNQRCLMMIQVSAILNQAWIPLTRAATFAHRGLWDTGLCGCYVMDMRRPTKRLHALAFTWTERERNRKKITLIKLLSSW